MSKPSPYQSTHPLNVAEAIAAQFAELEMVEAVVLGGSLATEQADASSDIDLYIYSNEDISVEARAHIIKGRSSCMELDNPYWETEDYWLEAESGIKVEMIYRNNWLLENLQDMFANNRAQMGFSTSLWHNVVTSKALFDRNGWYAKLQNLADVPYPDSLANAIIRKNFALLRGSLAAHPKQLTAAVKRNDGVFVNNLIYMIFNSYFDILFALNRILHPGAKRQLAYAENLTLKPENMKEDVEDIVKLSSSAEVLGKVEKLIDRLEILLSENFKL